MYAFTELQRVMAAEIGVEPGEYMHISDSFHIYGSYFADFEGFLKCIAGREPEDRVYNTDECLPFFLQGCDTLLGEEDMPEDKKALVEKRKAELMSS